MIFIRRTPYIRTSEKLVYVNRFLGLSFQVTRPLSYTKRQFDVEEEDVDKLALR